MHSKFLPASCVMRYAGTLLLSLALAGCFGSDLPPPMVKHAQHKAKTPEAEFQADVYVLQLTLARIALTQQPPALEEAQAHLALLGSPTAMQDVSAFQPLVVLEYDMKGEKGTERFAAPISLTDNSSQFPALLDVMNALGDRPLVLREIRLKIATFTPQSFDDFAKKDPALLRKALNDKADRIQSQAKRLSPIEQAHLFLRLTRFFTEHHFKDAAYIAVENAKQLLAEISTNEDTDKKVINDMNEELESLEVTLHKTMPFTLNF